MKTLLHIIGLSLSVILLVDCGPKTTQLQIANQSFEEYTLTPPNYTSNGEGLTGWAASPGQNSGVFYPTIGNHFTSVPDGNQVAWSWGLDICQTLTNTLVAGATYTLHANVGYNATENYGGYKIQLRVGGTVVAEDNNTKTPESGGWVAATTQYVSPPNDPKAGTPIQICLLSLDTESETNFDNVRLEETR